jgi:16S rRNA (cytosine1402-N4)-methyltransferase
LPERAEEEYSHTPVMLREVVACLAPRPGATLVDATVGGGGHAEALVRSLGPGGRLVAIDRDPVALEAAARRLAPVAEASRVRVDLVHANFAHLPDILDGLGVGAVDGVLFDLGASSAQFADPSRGFSYWVADAPLDMRMDPSQSLTAYHLVNGLSAEELAAIIRRYGEERWASRIAEFVVRRRRERGLIATTGELVEVVLAAVPASARRSGPHPARRTFQALRIAVNDELGALEQGLRAAVARLAPGGRVVVLSFHSLEDRIAKQILREGARGCTCPPEWPVCRCGRRATLRLLPGPLLPSEEEVGANPRARSAKLRAAVRLAEGEEAPTRAVGAAPPAVPPAAGAPRGVPRAAAIRSAAAVLDPPLGRGRALRL